MMEGRFAGVKGTVQRHGTVSNRTGRQPGAAPILAMLAGAACQILAGTGPPSAGITFFSPARYRGEQSMLSAIVDEWNKGHGRLPVRLIWGDWDEIRKRAADGGLLPDCFEGEVGPARGLAARGLLPTAARYWTAHIKAISTPGLSGPCAWERPVFSACRSRSRTRS